MLRLSKKADYALMALKHLATHTDVASVSAREIAEAYDIPVELMAKVLQRLARRGLLSSHQGTRGGYRLAKPPEKLVRTVLTVHITRPQDDGQSYVYFANRRMLPGSEELKAAKG